MPAPLTDGMKALTLWQPWASLMAEGVKSIETRSWRAPDALIGQRIAIHAAARDTDRDLSIPEECWDALGRCIGGAAPPHGAIVATARLVDCVPMVEDCDDFSDSPALLEVLERLDGSTLLRFWPEGLVEEDEWIDVSDQLPYGDFAPGRWAWLLDDIAPTTERCPWCMGRHAEAASHDPETCDWCNPLCPVCGGVGRCDPVPAKGRQRVWYWTPDERTDR